MRRTGSLILVALLGAALALGVAACGDDEGNDVSVPSATVGATTAATATTTAPPPTDTAPPATETSTTTTPADPGDSGGTQAPSGNSGEKTPEQAAKEFEEYCRSNPQACGP